MLRSEFREFLGAFKNAESLSSELQAAIAVETGLEGMVQAAVSDGRCVIIAGSAGSGKTHLVRSVSEMVSETLPVVALGTRPRGEHVLVVEDATELDVAQRLAAVASSSRSRVATLIAINEGPLVEAARADAEGAFGRALKLLHQGRRGVLSAFDAASPTVIDMGAFDPLDPAVVEKVFALPLLREVVEDVECSCDAEFCPRRRGWQQLQSPEVRNRLGSLLGIVHVLEREWLFRDLWDFVADVALGGSCEESPPTSPWFWRVFYGESRLSAALRELISPDEMPLPQIDVRIYYGDWGSEQLAGLIPGTELIHESQVLSLESDFRPFLYVKAQVLFMHKDIDVGARSLALAGGTYQHLLLRRNVGPVLKAINHYFSFGLRPGSETVLDLFVEHGVERRSQHIEGVIKLGEATASEFELRRPQVMINHPGSETRDGAGALYLVHGQSRASLRVDGERVRLLERGRTVRAADRAQVDLDWDLCQFFEEILRLRRWKNEFHVLHCDFARLEADERKYRATASPPMVEEA